MTPQAQLERIEKDVWAARDFLDQARKLLADGETEGLHDEGRQILLHAATVAACDAILAIDGLQVRGSEGGHVLRLEQAHKQLGEGHADLFERLDEARDRRIEASYRAGSPSSEDVDAAVQAVTELVRSVEDVLEPQLPGWDGASS